MWPYQWITDSVLGITDSVLPTQYYRSRESLWETAESIRSIAIINCLIRFQNTNLPNTQFARLICLRLPEWITVGDDCFARSAGRPRLGHAHQSAFLKKSFLQMLSVVIALKGHLNLSFSTGLSHEHTGAVHLLYKRERKGLADVQLYSFSFRNLQCEQLNSDHWPLTGKTTESVASQAKTTESKFAKFGRFLKCEIPIERANGLQLDFTFLTNLQILHGESRKSLGLQRAPWKSTLESDLPYY